MDKINSGFLRDEIRKYMERGTSSKRLKREEATEALTLDTRVKILKCIDSPWIKESMFL